MSQEPADIRGDDRRSSLLDQSILWCALAATALATLGWLGPVVGWRAEQGPAPPYLLLLVWFATLALAAFATWRLVRRSAYASLLLLAALSLWLVQPGRAGEAASWRLEWGVFGSLWVGVAIVIYRRLLGRTDELDRRMHLEGASIGLALALSAAAVYALFEPLLPALRAQWVAITLLLTWWCGWFAASRRYR
jgi:hypothetical protein